MADWNPSPRCSATHKLVIYMTTFSRRISPFFPEFRHFLVSARGKLGLVAMTACTQLERYETPIGLQSGISDTPVDRAARPASALEQRCHQLPPPISLLLHSTPHQARLAGPAPVAGATGCPAIWRGPPTPCATAQPLPSSPKPPAPADPPSA